MSVDTEPEHDRRDDACCETRTHGCYADLQQGSFMARDVTSSAPDAVSPARASHSAGILR
jgi:hypothetical protein